MAVVLITGCSTGFGLESALAFARKGDTVCATMRNVAKADALRKRAADEGLAVEVVALDVNDDASVAAAVTEIHDRFGTVDVLVNNAGVGYEGPVETMPVDSARALMETNFWGAFRMIRAVVPRMRAQRSGVIVNVTSIAGWIPGSQYQGMYAASKHALGALSESLMNEVGVYGVRVVCVEPGFFATAIADNAQWVDEGAVGTDYEADAAWFKRYMVAGIDNGADPRIVADGIVAAVDDPSTPLHVPLGEDAEFLVAVFARAGSFERWVEGAGPAVEQVAGPRPVPPAL